MSLRRDEYIRNKRKRLLWKIGLFALAVILLVGLLSFLSYRRAIRISAVELSGGILVTRAEVEREAISYLSGKYFWLFPRDNSLLYSGTGLARDLQEKFKRIDTISVSRKNWRTLSVNITERKPESLWCNTSVSDETAENPVSEKCYFMDSQSIIFAEAPHFSGDAYFKYFGLVEPTEAGPIGLYYMASSTEFESLTLFVSRLKAMSLFPQYIVGQDEQFTAVLAGGAKILFDMKVPLDKVADNLSILVHSAPFNDPALVGSMVDYIDMRFGNKLYYKLK